MLQISIWTALRELNIGANLQHYNPVIDETVKKMFGVPGLGNLLPDAIAKYDTNLVLAVVSLYASLGILGLFLGDVLMMILDPRIRLTEKGGAR